MALDFVFEVDERFGILIHRLHDVVSGLDPVLIPSIVSQVLERSFEFGQACEFISDDLANAGRDEELESICGSNGLSAFGLYRLLSVTEGIHTWLRSQKLSCRRPCRSPL
jgi:hypothetical protein